MNAIERLKADLNEMGGTTITVIRKDLIELVKAYEHLRMKPRN